MKKIIVATDLSSRSECAVQRGVLLARQFQAELILLNVVDDDLPAEVIEQELGQNFAVLDRHAEGLAGQLPSGRPDVKVEPGDAFLKVTEMAETLEADLIVLGAHRKQILKDVVTGTTLERVIRTGHHPVLMVNQPASADYRSVLMPVDLSDASAHAIWAARSLGLLHDVRLMTLHAFLPLARDMMNYVSAEKEKVTEHVCRTIEEARTELDNFLQETVLEGLEYEVMLHEGPAFSFISQVIEVEQPDLVVIGTHGRSGVKRMLLGSVADAILRNIDRDILIVPPAS
jgi:universal stress protein E